MFPLLDVKGSPGHGRGWSEAALSQTWPTQQPAIGSNNVIVKRGSNRSGWSGGTVEMQVVVYSPDSGSRLPEFKSRLCQELGAPG